MARKLNPEQHEAKKQKILAAAHNCFLVHGLQGASISMICKEASMSPGHLYHYFASKDAIIVAMTDEYLKSLHANINAHSESDDTATVLVSELWSMKSWTEVEHCRITFELFAEAARNEKVREIMIANTDKVRQLLIATLRAGQARGDVDASFDPEHTSTVLISLIYAAPMIPLIAPHSNFETSRGLITMMIRKFLKPAA